MFYNTGIATYIWVLTNRKPEHRRGQVQVIDATSWFRPHDHGVEQFLAVFL
jgi:type I restriction enzyme M protein